MDKIADLIAAERQRQMVKWGGPVNDDDHDTFDWLDYIDNQRAYWDAEGRISEQEMFVRIAALSIAALESLERKHG